MDNLVNEILTKLGTGEIYVKDVFAGSVTSSVGETTIQELDPHNNCGLHNIISGTVLEISSRPRRGKRGYKRGTLYLEVKDSKVVIGLSAYSN